MRNLRRLPVLAAMCAVLSFPACDLMGRLGGQDSLKEIVRDNPVDPGSIAPIDTSTALADGTVVSTSRPSFAFSYANGVASYSFQISASRDFTGAIIVDETGITEATHRIEISLDDNATYYWRMRPRFADDSERGWSLTRSFTIDIPAPFYAAPSDGVSVPSPFPKFSWTFPSGISSVELALSESVDFPAGSEMLTIAAQEYKWISPLENNKKYYWRVRSIDSGSPSDWSTTRRLTIAIPGPNLYTPRDGSLISDPNPAFSWGGFGSEALAYEFQIDVSSEFQDARSIEDSGKNFNTWGEPTLVLPDALQLDQQYFWRIRAKFTETYLSPWSDVCAFRKDSVSRIIDANISANSTLVFAASGAPFTYTSGSLSSWTASGNLKWSNDEVIPGKLLLGDQGLAMMQSDPAMVRLMNMDGDMSWSIALGEWRYLGTPAIMADGGVCAPAQGDADTFGLQAIGASGIKEWSYPLQWEFGTTSPVVGGDGTVYIGTGNKILAIGADGEKVWEEALPPNAEILSDLSIGAAGRILFIVGMQGTSGNFVYDIKPDDGSVTWTTQIPYSSSAFEPLVGADGTIFIIDHNGCAALDPDDGSIKWSVAEAAGSPQFHASVLGDDGLLYVLNYNGATALHQTDGSLARKYTIGTNLYSVPTMAPDGSIYSLGDPHLTGRPGFYVIPTTATGLADSPWPTARHDLQRTGLAGGP
jgi:hypothetical protein